jgi:hypothetical protein
MKIYHVCECCDRVYKVTESVSQTACGDLDSLTGDNTGDIMIEEPENGSSMVSGLCDDCHEEIYGSVDHFFYSPRIN